MAGTINTEWYGNATVNGTREEICGWFAVAINAESVEIDDTLAVTADGVWLSQDKIDAACEAIDKGV